MDESDRDTETVGDERVDAVVARLDELGELDLPVQLEVFSELHTSLAAVLEADTEPELTGGPRVPDDGQTSRPSC